MISPPIRFLAQFIPAPPMTLHIPMGEDFQKVMGTRGPLRWTERESEYQGATDLIHEDENGREL